VAALKDRSCAMLLEQMIARGPCRARRHLLTAKKETSDFHQGRVCVYVDKNMACLYQHDDDDDDDVT